MSTSTIYYFLDIGHTAQCFATCAILTLSTFSSLNKAIMIQHVLKNSLKKCPTFHTTTNYNAPDLEKIFKKLQGKILWITNVGGKARTHKLQHITKKQNKNIFL